MTDSSYELLKAGAAQFGAEISEREWEQFCIYARQLTEWNSFMNLTAITDEKEIIIKHFIDSLSIIPFLRKYRVESLIDVGTGAGFPGIPVKICCPDIQVTLMDSLAKRIRFLEHIAESLSLRGIRAVHSRAEDGGRNPAFREAFGCAAARAVAPMNILLEYCMPFVKKDGIVIAMKGIKEEPDYRGALQALGGILEAKSQFCLPAGPAAEQSEEMHRSILCIKKIKNISTVYPRKSGIPQKRPL